MLLSKQQEYVRWAVGRLGCVRQSQLTRLAALALDTPDFQIHPARMEAMLRQLRCANVVQLDGELVKLPGITSDERRLEAIDLMLALAEEAVVDFTAREPPPVLLRFTLGGAKLRLFAVVDMGDIVPQIDRRRTERVILLPQGGAPPSGVTLPDRHFFALRQQDGSHRFYAGGE